MDMAETESSTALCNTAPCSRMSRRFGVLGLAAAAVLALSACGGGSENASDDDASQSSSNTASTSTSGTDDGTSNTSGAPAAASDDSTSDDADDHSEDPAGDSQASQSEVFAALDAVEKQYPGSAVISVDHDDRDGHYGINLIHERQVIEVEYYEGTLTEKERERDADDLEEAERAAVSAREALTIALEDKTGEILDGLSLDEDNGTLRWEVDFEDRPGQDIGPLFINAMTGKRV